MYKYVSQPTLFDIPPSVSIQEDINTEDTEMPPELSALTTRSEKASEHDIQKEVNPDSKEKILTRVLLLYSDKTCTEYNPS